MTLTVQNVSAEINLELDWRKLAKNPKCFRLLGTHQIWTVTSIVIISSLTKELILYFYPFGLSIHRLISILVAESATILSRPMDHESWSIWGKWSLQDDDVLRWYSFTVNYNFEREINLTHSKGIKWAITSSKKD